MITLKTCTVCCGTNGGGENERRTELNGTELGKRNIKRLGSSNKRYLLNVTVNFGTPRYQQ